ncbi:MAG: CvpA family protein [Armatimonadetes bacterium]|nr:CvpA family protein [Armatimonadota bacterium]
MLLNWFDGVLLTILLAFIAYESRQEFGRSLLDTVAALSALHLSMRLAPWFGERFALLGRVDASRGAWMGILFLVLLVGAYFLSRFTHSSTRWTMDALDPLYGIVFGFAVGIICEHGIALALADMFASPGGEGPAFLENSVLAGELLHFRSLHEALRAMHLYQRGG